VALWTATRSASGGAQLEDDPMADLARLMEQIQRVPPISQAADKLLRLQGRPDSSAADLAKVVEVDAGLTVAVLRSSNSAAARPAQPIHSVRQAVTYVGERTVVALALSVCVPGGMVAPMAAYQSERGSLWRHSLRAAVAARELAGRLRRLRLDPDLAFTAGILHDLGKPVIDAALDAPGRARLVEAAVAKVEDFEAVERAEAGLSHAEVGEALAARWNLPVPLQRALRFHHHPSRAPEDLRALAYVVHVGAMHAALSGQTGGVDELCYRLDMGLLSLFDLSDVDFSALLARVDRDCAEALARVGDP
jgi:putative nucleotidyltransferase with HDIG domain